MQYLPGAQALAWVMLVPFALHWAGTSPVAQNAWDGAQTRGTQLPLSQTSLAAQALRS